MSTPENVTPLFPDKPNLTPVPDTCDRCGGKGQVERIDLVNVGGRTYYSAPQIVPCPRPACSEDPA